MRSAICKTCKFLIGDLLPNATRYQLRYASMLFRLPDKRNYYSRCVDKSQTILRHLLYFSAALFLLFFPQTPSAVVEEYQKEEKTVFYTKFSPKKYNGVCINGEKTLTKVVF